MERILSVRNPRTGAIDHAIRLPSGNEIRAACARAREAQPRWRTLGAEARIEALLALREALLVRRQELSEALTKDTGRKRETELEIDLVLASLLRWASLARAELVTRAGPSRSPSAVPGVLVERLCVPYPLVVVISPWNFPLLLAFIDTIPALLAGSAVVVKPSEMTPRFIGPVRAAIASAAAASVEELSSTLHFIEGDGETGRALVDEGDAVCFTGSVPTGTRVAECAARRLVPAYLELGGKDPAIVLATASLDHATSAILWGGVVNAGQSCLSIERVYVARPLHNAFLSMLTEKAQRVRLNWPETEVGEIGPLVTTKQAAIVAEQLDDARRQGALVHCGGHVEELGGGLYCRPTVLSRVHHGMKVMREETFGPLLPVMAFDTTEEAIELANDSDYGLSAAVFAGTTDEAAAVGRRLQAGAVSVNDAALTAVVHDAEKSAFARSGLGPSRMGAASLQRFFRRQALLVKEGTSRDSWWFS